MREGEEMTDNWSLKDSTRIEGTKLIIEDCKYEKGKITCVCKGAHVFMDDRKYILESDIEFLRKKLIEDLEKFPNYAEWTNIEVIELINKRFGVDSDG